jgi:7-cyano-7-deazaguanine tRNA-ribosyltransferase
MQKPKRIEALALHNLYVLKTEVALSKQAIKEGRLWEHVSAKARSHPKLMEALARVGDRKGFSLDGTAVTKAKALLLFDRHDYDRPELVRFRTDVRRRWKPRERALVVLSLSRVNERFFIIVPRLLETAAQNGFSIAIFRPFYGLVPLELYCDYPASQTVMPAAVDKVIVDSSLAEGEGLAKKHRFAKVTVLYDDDRATAAKLARLCGGRLSRISPKYVAELRKRAPGLGVH